MRKSLATLLALLVLIVPLLAACGSASTTPSATTAPVATTEATEATAEATEATTAEATAEATEATTAEATAEATEATTAEATAGATEATTAEATTAEATEATTADATTEATEATTDSSKPRIALVTDLGKVNDGTFNQFAYEGAEKATKELGLEFKYIETQAQSDYEKNIQTFVDEKYDVIITVGFLIQNATQAAAAAHPEITFIGVDQYYEPGKVTDNLVGLQFREDQAGFLAGALAGMMTESNTIGVVGGLKIPPVQKFLNAYENGAKFVNPDVNVLSTYNESFTDPAKGGSDAVTMIGEGADVIFGAGGPTGSGGIKAAAEKGVYVIGVDQDEYITSFANGKTPGADKILTSAIKRVDVAVYDQIKAVVEGTFKGNGIATYEAANDGVGFAPFHDTDSTIPDAVKARIDEIQKALAAGSLTTGVDPVSGEVDQATIPEATPFVP